MLKQKQIQETEQEKKNLFEEVVGQGKINDFVNHLAIKLLFTHGKIKINDFVNHVAVILQFTSSF